MPAGHSAVSHAVAQSAIRAVFMQNLFRPEAYSVPRLGRRRGAL